MLDSIQVKFPRVREIIFSIQTKGGVNNVAAPDVQPLLDASRRVLSLWRKNSNDPQNCATNIFCSNWLEPQRKPNFSTVITASYEAVNKAIAIIRSEIPVNGYIRAERCILEDGTEVPLQSIMQINLQVGNEFVPILQYA